MENLVKRSQSEHLKSSPQKIIYLGELRVLNSFFFFPLGKHISRNSHKEQCISFVNNG